MSEDLNSKDFYQRLCVSRDSTKKDISRAYRDIASVYHPDSGMYAQNKDLSEKNAGLSEKHLLIFKLITEAYNTLSSKRLRAEYDLTLPPEDLTHQQQFDVRSGEWKPFVGDLTAAVKIQEKLQHNFNSRTHSFETQNKIHAAVNIEKLSKEVQQTQERNDINDSDNSSKGCAHTSEIETSNVSMFNDLLKTLPLLGAFTIGLLLCIGIVYFILQQLAYYNSEISNYFTFKMENL